MSSSINKKELKDYFLHNPFFLSRSMSIYPSLNYRPSSNKKNLDSSSDNSLSQILSKPNDKKCFNDLMITNESVFSTMETMKDSSSIDDKPRELQKTKTISFIDLDHSHPHKQTQINSSYLKEYYKNNESKIENIVKSKDLEKNNSFILTRRPSKKSTKDIEIPNKTKTVTFMPNVIEETIPKNEEYICVNRSTAYKTSRKGKIEQLKERKTAMTKITLPTEGNEGEDIFGRTPKTYRSKHVNKFVTIKTDNETYIIPKKEENEVNDGCNCNGNNCIIM